MVYYKLLKIDAKLADPYFWQEVAQASLELPGDLMSLSQSHLYNQTGFEN